jgi:hypothetical protein
MTRILISAQRENQNMQTVGNEAKHHGAIFAVIQSRIGVCLGRFKIELDGSEHVHTVFSDVGQVLGVIELDVQNLIVDTIK